MDTSRYSRYEIDSWYKRIVGLKPEKSERTSDVLWTISYFLALDGNYQTPASLISGLYWNNAKHVPALRIITWIVNHTVAIVKSESKFKELMGTFTWAKRPTTATYC